MNYVSQFLSVLGMALYSRRNVSIKRKVRKAQKKKKQNKAKEFLMRVPTFVLSKGHFPCLDEYSLINSADRLRN